MTTRTTPRTAAGRALLAALTVAGHIGDDWPWRILAIEAESADALLAALRALVAAFDRNRGKGLAFAIAIDDGIEQARVLLRDLSPKEEGQ